MTGERTEVAVIGGGAIGLSIAFELAGRGRRVTLLERGEPGAEASAVAAGMLAPTSESEGNAASLLNFQLDSLRRYPEFTAAVSELSGLGCGYRSEGTLWVARHRDDELELEHLAALQRERGLTSRMVTAREARRLEPYVVPRAVGGLLVDGDHQIDPRRLLPALALAVERRGVDLRRRTRVSGVFPEAGGVRIAYDTSGESGELRADIAVIAAGVWSEDGIDTPAPPLGLRPVKGQLLRLRGEPIIQRVVRTPDVYLVPRSDGELIVGASEEEQGFDAQPTAGAVFDLLRDAWEVLPGIYDLHLDEISVGFRPAVRDHLPVIGSAGAPGVFLATGHYRNGILLAPATAYWLAEAIESGETPPLLAQLQASRLAGAG